jgi:cell division protein FtsI (penicillin-binding protein 3)
LAVNDYHFKFDSVNKKHKKKYFNLFKSSWKKQEKDFFCKWRFYLVLLSLIIIVGALIARMVFLMQVDRAFLLKQGNARSLRIINIPAYRGMILDRNGEPLAVSTLVNSIWINPQDFPNTKENIRQLGHFLNVSSSKIKKVLIKNAKREFVYIRRGVNPNLAKEVKKLGIPGVYLEREYRRYYPDGEVAAHVVGFTNIDDEGQEGLELAYNSWLRGQPGKEKVLQDRYRHMVAVIADISNDKPGHDLTLSLDSRIQFLAYQELQKTIEKFKADSGSVVVLNPKTGEVLAMVNQPSYNPNKRSTDHGQFRNRAVTDTFEPGSTMKVFSIASALDSGKYKPATIINTNPGWFMIGRNMVREDKINHGKLTLTQVLQKSSNVGVAKITLALPPEHFIDLLKRVGFGLRTQGGFPGESAGLLPERMKWKPFDLATLAFGYGITVTPLQLVHAYSVIANDGLNCPVSFLKIDKPKNCAQAIDKQVAHEMLTMLESVVQPGGTGTSARIKGYRIAGKTGTAYIASAGGYNKKQHMSSFVGIAPVSDPKLVVAVIIRNPKNEYYGALVAAPAFAKIMGGALGILDVPADEGSVAQESRVKS